jgi:hypothetical protein
MGLPTIAVPEYSLKLPSTGKEIKYRPFLVKEEKLLLLAMESEDQQQIVTATKNVINNCVFGEINVDDLPIFDIEYIFLWLRGRAKGEMLDLKYTCPTCETIIPVQVNLEDIKIASPEKDSSKIGLTDTVGIVFKYPNISMQSKIEAFDENDEIGRLFASIQLCIDYIYDGEALYSSKDHTEKELNDFIESLTDANFVKISEFFENMPKLKHTIKLQCSNQVKAEGKKSKKCNYKEDIVLEGLASFFD